MKNIEEFLQEILMIYESGKSIDESQLYYLLSKWKELLIRFSTSTDAFDKHRSLHYYKLDIQFAINMAKVKHCVNQVQQLLQHQLIQYIEVELEIIESQNHQTPKYQMNWTGTKAQLVELIYSLFISGCINQGNIKLKELIAVFSQLLNIDLEHFHSTLNNIINRKDDPNNEENRALFLSRLTRQLQSRMAEFDERM